MLPDTPHYCGGLLFGLTYSKMSCACFVLIYKDFSFTVRVIAHWPGEQLRLCFRNAQQGFSPFQQMERLPTNRQDNMWPLICVADTLSGALVPWGLFMSSIHFSRFTPCAYLAPAGLTVGCHPAGPLCFPLLFTCLVYHGHPFLSIGLY